MRVLHTSKGLSWDAATETAPLTKDAGEVLLAGHPGALRRGPDGRAVRIMVTMPGEAATEPCHFAERGDDGILAILQDGRIQLVFHGGSGSELRDIHEALDYGVVKMNVDTDMQYAFTRAIADHCFRNYDGVLRVDGEVGSKKVYDPRSYMAFAEKAMAARVVQGGDGTAVRRHDDDAESAVRIACATMSSISR